MLNMAQSNTGHKWMPTMAELIREMKVDLRDLFAQNPDGLSISYLSGWYGESTQRILKACQELQRDERVRILRAANKALYILPAKEGMDEVFTALSAKQRILVRFVMNELINQKAELLRTNYTQLSRVLSSSYGGMRIRLQRCVDLGFLVIVHPSKPAMPDQLIIGLGPKAREFLR